VQHEFYHQYTADEHTLMCLTQLDKGVGIAGTHVHQLRGGIPQCRASFVLYLALLLHDAGKPLHTGRHSEVGGQIAAASPGVLPSTAPPPTPFAFSSNSI